MRAIAPTLRTASSKARSRRRACGQSVTLLAQTPWPQKPVRPCLGAPRPGTVPGRGPQGRVRLGRGCGVRRAALQWRCDRAVIRARGLEKRYGDKRVLRGVEFELARDGFLLVTGPNGSGKTTLLRLCAGLAAPTRGELDISVPRGRIGLLAHEPLVYRELTALENLELYGRLYRVPERRERIGMVLERFGLWDVRHERAGSYSRGMLQRLARCCTNPTFSCSTSRTAASTTTALGCSTANWRKRAAARLSWSRRTSPHASSASRRPSSRSHDVPRGCRCSRAQGPAARVPSTRHPARDAPLRRLDPRRLPLRSSRRFLRSCGDGTALGRAQIHGVARPLSCVRRRTGAGRDRRARPCPE